MFKIGLGQANCLRYKVKIKGSCSSMFYKVGRWFREQLKERDSEKHALTERVARFWMLD